MHDVHLDTMMYANFHKKKFSVMSSCTQIAMRRLNVQIFRLRRQTYGEDWKA